MLIIEDSPSRRQLLGLDGPRPGPYPFEGQCYGAIHRENYSHGYRCTRTEDHRGEHMSGVGDYAEIWTDSTPGAISPSVERRATEKRLKKKYGKFYTPRPQSWKQRNYYRIIWLKGLFRR